MFKSLKRLTYQVSDVEQAKLWYSKILNTQPIFDTPGTVIFNIGDHSLSLIPGPKQMPVDNGRIGAFWEVESVDDTYYKLIALGATAQSELKTIFNIRMGKVIDPFGNIIGLTGPAPETLNRSVESQPSQTALTAAFCRALANYDDRDEVKGPDFLAEIFLPEEAKSTLKEKTSRENSIMKLISPRLYGYFYARTAYIDKLFKKSLMEEIPQIVILGAGYDTRAIRFRPFIKNTKIFELDILPTQERKVSILQKSNVLIPNQLNFVKINFSTDKLDEVLAEAGYLKDRNTLFIWEGVSYYLAEESVNKTLGAIKSFSAANSMLCFDYMTEKIESVVASEPFRFWIGRDKIESFLSDRGYKIVEHYSPEEIEKKFLALSSGTIAYNTLPFFCFVNAKICE